MTPGTLPTWARLARALFPLAIGFGAAFMAAAVAALGTKFVIAFAVLIPLLGVALALGSANRIQQLLIVGLALTIPIQVDVNFLFRKHIGGAPSISVGASLLCVLALACIWFYRYRTRQLKPLFVSEPSMVWASLMFMFVGVLSLWNARYPELVLLEEIRLAMLFATMLVVMNFRTGDSLRTLVFFITVATCLQGAWATAQYLTHSSLGGQYFGGQAPVELKIGEVAARATGTLGHPNVLGYYLESALPLSLALLLVERRVAMRLWYLIAFVATLAGLIVTLSRGAWLSVPVSCGITFWVLYRRKLFRLSSGVALSLMGIVAIVFLYLALPTIERRLLHADYQSAASRMPLNYAALSVIRQYPVLGVGLNNFGEVFQDYDTTGHARMLTEKIATPYSVSSVPYKHVVHNLILWVCGEVGIVGLLAFLWIFASAFRVAWKAYRGADDWARGVLVGCLAGMLGHLVHAQVDPGFRISPSVSMLFYAMFGLIGAISLQARRRATAAAAAAESELVPEKRGERRVQGAATGLRGSDSSA